MTHSSKKFFKATLLISISALLSRVFGLLRQTLLAAKFGATSGQGYNDCYNASFTLPDIIFNLIVFGAVSIVLIPYFSGLLKKGLTDKLHKSCSSFLNFFFIFISIFIIVGFFFAPIFVRKFLVTGWTNEENILLTIKMTRIILLQTLFMTLSGIFGSYLNAIEKFTAYAFAILSYNLGIIFGIVVLTPFMGIEGAAWGAVLGGFTHFTIQASGSFYNGFKFSFGLPKLTKEIRQLILVAIPRIIGISADQFVKFFIVQFASYIFTGAIFIFYNAENFSMVAYGMIAVSLSTTSFPIFSKLYVAKEYDSLLNNLFERIRSLLFLILPISMLMIIFKNEIISLLIGYKNFSTIDVKLTADALSFYILGIPAFSMTILIVKFYYAQKKSVIPMIISLASATITVLSAYFLSKKFAVVGLSVGRSIGYTIQMILLLLMIFFYNKKEKIFTVIPIKQIKEIIKIILINIVIFLLAVLVHSIIGFSFSSKFIILLFLIIEIVPLVSIYFLLSYLFKLNDLRALIKIIPFTRKTIIRIVIFLLVILFIIIGLVFFMNIHIYLTTKKDIYHTINRLPNKEVAIILGAKVYRNGKMSDMLEDRVRMGLQLYKANKIKRILVTGIKRLDYYDEPKAMKEYLIAHGVSEDDILVDNKCKNTLRSIYRARQIFNIGSAIVVTQNFHLFRSLYFAKKLKIDAVGIPADNRRYLKKVYYQIREIFARVKGFIQIKLIS